MAAPSPANRGAYVAAGLLEPGLREVYHAEEANQASLLKRTQLFTVLTSERAFEEHLAMGALSSDPGLWDYKRHGRMQADAISRGYKKQFVHLSRGAKVEFEMELLQDNQYPGSGIPSEAETRVKGHAEAAEQYREKAAAEVFINAFTDSGTSRSGFPIAGVDGVGLCSDAHPYGPENTGDTQSNEGTLSLTVDNVDTTRQNMRAWTNDRGDLISVDPTELLVPPELEADAERIAQSVLEPGHANNDTNVVGRRIRRVITWDYLTDANAWFLMDPARRAKYLVWYDRIKPMFMNATAQDEMLVSYMAWFRFSRGHTSYQFVYGQNPS